MTDASIKRPELTILTGLVVTWLVSAGGSSVSPDGLLFPCYIVSVPGGDPNVLKVPTWFVRTLGITSCITERYSKLKSFSDASLNSM